MSTEKIKNAHPLIGAAILRSLNAINDVFEKILCELKKREKKLKRKKKKLPLQSPETVRIREAELTIEYGCFFSIEKNSLVLEMYTLHSTLW